MTFPHTATIQEMTETNGKSVYTDIGTTPCFWQAIDDAANQILGFGYGKGAYCYLPFDANVTDKMRLIIFGETYGVQGIKPYPYGQKHKKALLKKA